MQVLLRQRHFSGKMGSTSGGNIHQNQPQQAQGLTALLVMIAVLCILLAYCFWGAPWCRSFCRRRVCCFCPMDDPEGIDMGSTADGPAATPTIILLPFGRMLVVDGAVFAQLQADSRGLDLMELGENIIRTQRYQTGSSPSIFQVDSETTSKGLSPILDSFAPPTYDSIFGSRHFVSDLPPSYSEISLQIRTRALHDELNNRRNSINQLHTNLHRPTDICPIAEEESDRIATSEEDIRESRV
ncbi:hypothetical protein CBL_03866 [Carabus blaptoides fortunei]